ncbi:MAG: D-cysteine desulfhydrase family protein [Syntrophomonadaceae bacterium]|nr:D-cysteine desulfhydrase family protein [Syntrophomonadaceae bacterium]
MLSKIERVSLGFFPTPWQELKNLSDYLGGPRIFTKREDQSGLALGGNKVRKLEYILADALAQKADVIITFGAVSSNHARQTAAAAALLGLECQLILTGKEPEQPQGNYLLDKILGAKTFCVRNREVEDTLVRLTADNLKQGKRSYVIPAGGHTILGTIAYIQAYQEIKQQFPFTLDGIITAIGTGTTYAGLYLGSQLDQNRFPVVGISVGGDKSWCASEATKVVQATLQHLDLSVPAMVAMEIYDEYVGEGYTIPYPQVRLAIELLARTEGILLDPVYSGKAMAGLIDLIHKGRFQAGDNIMFLHTGGAPELFTMHRFLSEK